ncbi:TonB-dependent receptor family protein [Sphingomonas canadensis]|uniref:TonB-dependent receptor family protein n=1 Tax=Sphingomonas canadensis TaxID=1219257 RepID=A0ABW3H8J2_9SPHN|nr:TonB-dependent receptor [Sphingomonas canadensis]MCW3835771.1 TonB-dependent receptor [Sphingomonas canadensis]
MRFPFLLCGACAAAFAVLPSAALAQSDAADPADPSIVVTAPALDPVDVTLRPGGTDTVTSDEYQDVLAVSLRDTLALSPGVYTQPRFGQEVRLSVRGSGLSRGFHMRGLTILLDGVPVNLADDNGDFQELDPALLARIDVYRGGNALRFGGSTLGGAINAVSPTGRSHPGVTLRLDGGSFGTVRGLVSGGFSDDRGDVWLAVSGDRSDGERQHSSRGALRFSGNAGLRLNDRIETRFYALASYIRQDLPGSLTLAEALSTPGLSRANNIAMDQERDITSVRIQNRTSVDLGGGAAFAFGGHFNAKQLFHPIFQVIDQKSEDRGLFASLDWDSQLGGMPISITLGSQARFGNVNAKQYVNVAGDRGALTSDVKQRAHTINTYAELRLTPVERLTLVLGGVHSDGWRKIDNRLVPANNATRDYDAFSPKLGVVWEAGDQVQFYANYSRSVEFPGFGELVQAPIAGFVDVAPQRAWTFEMGTRGSAGIASWDLTFYRASLKGEMLQYTVSPGFPASTFNGGRTRHQGIEAGLDLAPLPWLKLRQMWTFSDFRFRGDAQYGDNRLPVIPQHLYRAELRLGGDALSVTPRFEWVPEGAWADYRNQFKVPAYATIGLGAEAKLDRVTLFLDARNLTGKKAVGDISAAITANAASVAFYPIERRAVYGGVRVGF